MIWYPLLPAYFLPQTLTMLEIFEISFLSLFYLEVIGKDEWIWETIQESRLGEKSSLHMGRIHPTSQRTLQNYKGGKAEGTRFLSC